jgi:tricorn protease
LSKWTITRSPWSIKPTAWEITQYTWSPDSRWIAFTRPEERQFGRIALYSIETGEWQYVTDEWFASSEPEFSADGKLLFFVSSRDFRPRYSQTEWNHAYFDMQRIYFVTLTRDARSPLEPRSDEVSVQNGDDKDNDDERGKETKPDDEDPAGAESPEDESDPENSETPDEDKNSSKSEKDAPVTVQSISKG